MASKSSVKQKTGLRQRQKEIRRKQILEAARVRFAKAGFKSTTMEAIADDVGMSSVTIANYYGSKVGLLLALVQESDALLIDRLKPLMETTDENAVGVVSQFGETIRENAINFLSKSLWRQVLAASITDESEDFRETYEKLDNKLIELLELLIVKLQNDRKLDSSLNPTKLADTIFSLQNNRFIQFMSSDNIGKKEMARLFRDDVAFLLQHYIPNTKTTQ